jgi:hypothetical protein
MVEAAKAAARAAADGTGTTAAPASEKADAKDEKKQGWKGLGRAMKDMELIDTQPLKLTDIFKSKADTKPPAAGAEGVGPTGARRQSRLQVVM